MKAIGSLAAFRQRTIVLILVVTALALTDGLILARAMHASTSGRWVLPVDDAYIHQQYARQLAMGRPFRYSAEAPPSSGATSLLYPVILAGAWRLGLHGDLLSAFAFTLGIACLAGSAWLMFRLGHWLYAIVHPNSALPASWVGALAALLMLSNGALLWAFGSGMETGLFILLLLAALDALAVGTVWRYCLWASLLATLRPEGLILAAVGALLLALPARRNREPLSASPATGAQRLGFFIPVACGMVHPVLNLALTGNLTANAYRAKSWLANVPFVPRNIFFNLLWTARDLAVPLATGLTPSALSGLPESLRSRPGIAFYLPPLFVPLGLVYLIISTYRCRRRGPLALILWLLFNLVLAIPMRTATWHYYRYVMPAYALGLLAGALGMAGLATLIAPRGTRFLFLALTVMVLTVSVWSMPDFVGRYRSAVSTTLHQQIHIGEWVLGHLPTEAVIAVSDAGAIAYYGERPTYDLVGLTGTVAASQAWTHGPGSMFETMEHETKRPGYLVTNAHVPEGSYLTRTSLARRELFRVSEQQPSEIAYSDYQTVYQADWHLANSGDRPYQPNILELLPNLTIVDHLDIADLASEKTHHYFWWNTLPKGSYPTEIAQLGYHTTPEAEVLDGGRLLTGGETFTVHTTPGKPLLLVGRFLGQSAVHLQVAVNGRRLGPWGYPAIPGQWQEQYLPIPADYVTGEQTRIEIRVDATRPDLEFHRPFYYWCLQGDLPSRSSAPMRTLNARVGEHIVLIGYSLRLEQVNGAYKLALDLYWQAMMPIAESYKVFVHWSDSTEHILAQDDRFPSDDLRPTWSWQADEVIFDRHLLTLAESDLPQSKTTVYVGLYDPQTGHRLPIAGGDQAGRLPIAQFTQDQMP